MTPDAVRTNSRLSGLLRRYHTWPVIRDQNVAEHCWHVSRIFLTIFGQDKMSSNLWVYIMYHDSGEIVTGDLPYPIKSKHPAMKQTLDAIEEEALRRMGAVVVSVTTEDRQRVKLCEMIEMWEYGVEELCRGNGFARPIIANCEAFVGRAAVELDVLQRVLDYMGDMSAKMR